MTPSDPRPLIVPVGGLLGAGKTTLIIAAGRILGRRGLRSAAIVNDQGTQLVDAVHVRKNGMPSGQVTGGCFCCRFSDLIEAAEEIKSLSPGIIFVEPVGSCTDLSATILQPLKNEFRDRYRVAPLTVLVDPAQAQRLTKFEGDSDLAFLFTNQIAEADVVAFTKSDLHAKFPELNAPEVRYMSALTGEGVSGWLDEVLTGKLPVGGTLLNLDYERYAAAEAALGWLNWSASIQLHEPLSPSQVIGPFLDNLRIALSNAGACIVHLKMLDDTPGSYLKAAVTASEDNPSIEGNLTASPEMHHEISVNVRAVIDAPDLERIFRLEVGNLPGTCQQHVFQCFRPPPPRPQRRYSYVVPSSA